MKKKKLFCFLIFVIAIISTFTYIFPLNNLTVAFADEQTVYLGGTPAGFSLIQRGAYILGVSDVLTEKGLDSPSKDSEIMAGDIILAIDGVEVNTAVDIEKQCADGKVKILTVNRNGKTFLTEILPSLSINGTYKLGVFIRDAINGIGTVTFLKKGVFASLGHPVIEDNGQILKINDGNLYNCTINGYIKGQRGKAGELRGSFKGKTPIGKVKYNYANGVYGTLSDDFDYSNYQKIEVGNAEIGDAEIYTTISGNTPSKYSISIVKIDEESEIKNFVIKINDSTLLEETGGIVQGMSGSPICQNGKLVGAVTHVFVNDPTRGFGISIKNMIDRI